MSAIFSRSDSDHPTSRYHSMAVVLSGNKDIVCNSLIKQVRGMFTELDSYGTKSRFCVS